MKKDMSIAIFTLIMFAVFVGVANARIEARIEIKESTGNSISGETVPLYTVAYVYGTYEDLDESTPASASMIVRFDDGSGWVYKDTLFTGTVTDGETIERTYTMTEQGSYQFIWRCEKEGGGTNDDNAISCTNEVATDRVAMFVIPEPGTLAGLITALSALGLLAFKKMRAK